MSCVCGCGAVPKKQKEEKQQNPQCCGGNSQQCGCCCSEQNTFLGAKCLLDDPIPINKTEPSHEK